MAGNSTAVRAGRAFVELSLRDAGVAAGLKRLQSRFASAGKMLAGVGAAGVAAGSAVLGSIGALTGQVLDRNAEFAKLAEIYGDTAEGISTLAYAADASGSSFEKLKSAMENLPERIADAAANGGSAADAFRKMNLNADELLKLPFSEQIAKIADAMDQVATPTERAAMASKLFSDVGLEGMIPLLKDGSAGLRAYAEEAKRVGAVVSTEDAQNSVKVTRALGAAYAALKNTVLELGAAILPQADTIADLSRQFQDLIRPVREYLAANRETVLVVAGVAAGVAAAGAALVGIGTACAVASVAFGGLAAAATAAVSVAGAVVGAVLSPVGLAAVAVVGLGAALLALSDDAAGLAADVAGSIGEALDRVKAYLQESLGTVTQAFQGVKDALAAGDLRLAGQVAMAGLEVEFRRAVAVLTGVWNDFKAFFVDAWHDGVMLVELGWNEALRLMSSAAGEMVKFVAAEFGGLLKGIIDLAVRVGDALDFDTKNLKAGADLLASGGLGKAVDESQKKVDADAQKKSFAITNAAQKDQADRTAARAADKASADADVEAARKRLAGLNEVAAAAAEAARQARAKQLEKVKAAVPNIAVADAVRGQFGGELAKQSLGGPRDVAQKQLAETQKQTALLEKSIDRLDKLVDAGGLAFT